MILEPFASGSEAPWEEVGSGVNIRGGIGHDRDQFRQRHRRNEMVVLELASVRKADALAAGIDLDYLMAELDGRGGDELLEVRSEAAAGRIPN